MYTRQLGLLAAALGLILAVAACADEEPATPNCSPSCTDGEACVEVLGNFEGTERLGRCVTRCPEGVAPGGFCDEARGIGCVSYKGVAMCQEPACVETEQVRQKAEYLKLVCPGWIEHDGCDLGYFESEAEVTCPPKPIFDGADVVGYEPCDAAHGLECNVTRWFCEDAESRGCVCSQAVARPVFEGTCAELPE